MPVNNKPFESEFGFKSPGFSVNSLGQLSATSLVLTAPPEESSSGIELGNFNFVNNSILTTNQNLTEILYGIATNEIDSIGNSLTVNAPQVNFTGTIKLASFTTVERNDLSASDGVVIFNTTTDKIEFFNGNWFSLPNGFGNFQFTSNTITATSAGDITITPPTGDSLVTTNFEADSIAAETISVDSATINSIPTQATDVTNKRYVDRTSVALAIALGS